jgi:alkylation response protein AidB-like acyl-CoA dehydrogenase
LFTGFLIEKGTPGLVVGQKLHKMGLRTSPMSEVALVDCEVPASSILGKEGSGQAIFTHSMEWERTCILASELGMMQRLQETCVAYARDRKQFGESIGKYSAIGNKIADMAVRLETGRLLVYKAAWMKSQGRHALKEASMAKLFVSEACVQTCLDAIQIHGGYGYMTEYEMERDLRDAISGKLYSGTSEIQRVIIAGFHGL